jgi:FixJ family two-component response regulator
VDDERSVRVSLTNLLERATGYKFETFASATEHLAHLPEASPACLALDVLLPDLDELALQRQLAVHGRMEQIVFITGHGDIPTGIQAMKRAAVDFLPKSFEEEALLDAVAQALARSAENWRRHGQMEQIRTRISTLTPREFEVFRLVIAGFLQEETARSSM